MVDTAPFEVMATPFEVWVAAIGTAFPNINAAPSASWTKLGTNGSRSMDEDGVTVRKAQTLNYQKVAGSTSPVKAFRTDEDLIVQFSLVDVTAEMMSYVLNGNAVTDVAATATVGGYRHVSLYRGQEVTEYALLIRGDKSPYGEGWNSQYEIYRGVIDGTPEPQYNKGPAAMLRFEVHALYSESNSGTGRFVAQDASPTG